MENFLLNIVLILLLVIVLLGFILRLVFRMGHPYGGGVIPAGGSANSSGNGNGLFLFLIILLVAGLAYHFSEEERGNKAPSSKDHYEYQEEKPDYIREPLPPPRIKEPSVIESQEDPTKLRVNREEGYYEDQEPEITRYNQAPRHQPDNFYAIQIAAYADPDLAKNAYYNLRFEMKDIQLIYFYDDDIPFRLVVGEFSSKEEARRYQKRQGIEGFVRNFVY